MRCWNLILIPHWTDTREESRQRENVRCDPISLCFIVYLNFFNLTFTDKRPMCLSHHVKLQRCADNYLWDFVFLSSQHKFMTSCTTDKIIHVGVFFKFRGCMWTFVSLRLNLLDLFWWSERNRLAVGKEFAIVREVNFPGTISMLNTLLCGCRWIFEKLTFSWLWCFSDVLLLISSVSAQFSITRCVTRNPHWPDLCWCFSLCPEDISSCFLWVLMFPSSNLHKWTYYIFQNAQLWHKT